MESRSPSKKAELPPIPAKRYFTIGEVSELCGVKPHVLRYWEQEFTQLKPVKRRGNRRYYQHHEVLLIRRIRELLYEEGFTISGYFSGLAAVSKHKLAEDPHAKWIVQFHPLVTQAMDTLTYRQFNYAQMMSHTSQLARWIHKQLSLKFTFASLTNPFEMRYSTIKRDSALLNSYARERDAIAALDSAWNELKTNGVLMKFDKAEVRGLRGKLEDVVYTLTPSLDFVSAMKAANKRESLAVGKLVDSGDHLKDQKKR